VGRLRIMASHPVDLTAVPFTGSAVFSAIFLFPTGFFISNRALFLLFLFSTGLYFRPGLYF